MTDRTRQQRYRILIRQTPDAEWTIWGRYSSNAHRTYGDATWLTARPDVADVRIECTTTINEHLTPAELLNHLTQVPPPPAVADRTPPDNHPAAGVES